MGVTSEGETPVGEDGGLSALGRRRAACHGHQSLRGWYRPWRVLGLLGEEPVPEEELAAFSTRGSLTPTPWSRTIKAVEVLGKPAGLVYQTRRNTSLRITRTTGYRVRGTRLPTEREAKEPEKTDFITVTSFLR